MQQSLAHSMVITEIKFKPGTVVVWYANVNINFLPLFFRVFLTQYLTIVARSHLVISVASVKVQRAPIVDEQRNG